MANARTMVRAISATALAVGVSVAGTGALAVSAGTAGATVKTRPATAVGSVRGRAALAAISAPGTFTEGRGAHSGRFTAWPHQAGSTETLFVSPTGTDNVTPTNPGTPNLCITSDNPCKTLGHALTEAATTVLDTVVLAPGTYKEQANPNGAPTVVPDTIHEFDIVGATFTYTYPDRDATTYVITAAGFTYGIQENSSFVFIGGITVTNARRSGIWVTPATSAVSGVHLTEVYLAGDDVVGNDTCGTSPTVATKTATACATPTPESDYGEGIHIESLVTGFVETSYVADNYGGILVTDEHGPSSTITIDYNTAVTNLGDCGITLAGHNPTAVHTSGATTGKPDTASAGVYHVDVYHNASEHNGAAGFMDAGGAPGTGVYDNAFVDNLAVSNGLAGVAIHSHAPLQDMDTVVIAYNRVLHNSLHGGPDGGPGDIEGPPASADMVQGAGIQVLAAVVPVQTTVIVTNVVSTDFYGLWLSPGVSAAAATISTNVITVTAGGTPIFNEPTPDTGYVMAGSDGGAFTFGTLTYQGSIPGTGHLASAPTVGIAETPDGGGYWEVTAAGQVYTFGDAVAHGTLLTEGGDVSDVVGIASTPDGGGYWLAEADGAVHAYGDAVSYGTLPADHVSVSDVEGIAATATGTGYWLVGDDGGVFAFGSAGFQGSVPALGIHISNVKGIVPAPSGQGYWLIGSDGGVFSFGTSTFYGSLPGLNVTVDNIVGALPAPTGQGYWMVGSDGGVFAFGTAHYAGSVPGVGVHINDVVGLTSNPI